jgi:acyl-coenzyme A thioesterase PaaI-like protein
MRLNPIEIANKIPYPKWRRRALDMLLTVGIPFNRWLGLQIHELSEDEVVILSPERTLRRNHVGGAHACALALMGEYPAGLLIAQNFGVDEFRIILSELHMHYNKQGHGLLKAIASSKRQWPQPDADGVLWVELDTHIYNEKNEEVAACHTRWQVKPWSLVHEKS